MFIGAIFMPTSVNMNFTTKMFHGFSAQILVLALVMLSGKTPCLPEKITTPPGKIIFIENSWNEALKQAAKQKKYIFADAYATWCGPCKMLKDNTFSDEKAATFFNSNFINVSIDMEKGQGPALAAQWQIRAYPTLIIFDAKGNPLSGSVGYIDANQLIRFGKKALSKQH